MNSLSRESRWRAGPSSARACVGEVVAACPVERGNVPFPERPPLGRGRSPMCRSRPRLRLPRQSVISLGVAVGSLARAMTRRLCLSLPVMLMTPYKHRGHLRTPRCSRFLVRLEGVVWSGRSPPGEERERTSDSMSLYGGPAVRFVARYPTDSYTFERTRSQVGMRGAPASSQSNSSDQ